MRQVTYLPHDHAERVNVTLAGWSSVAQPEELGIMYFWGHEADRRREIAPVGGCVKRQAVVDEGGVPKVR